MENTQTETEVAIDIKSSESLSVSNLGAIIKSI